jgi:hypothetical protein
MYRWQTEDPEEQAAFLKATVGLFGRVTGGKQLQLIGFSVPDGNTSTCLYVMTSGRGKVDTSFFLLQARWLQGLRVLKMRTTGISGVLVLQLHPCPHLVVAPGEQGRLSCQ